MSTVNVKIKDVYDLSMRILVSYGLNEEAAKVTIESLLDAEISGVSSHGLTRLPSYIDRIVAGLINVSPNVQIEKDLGSVVLIDGDNGLGQVVAYKTLEICFNKLKTNSSITAFVKNSNHFGTTSYYTKQAADKGFFSMISSNAGPTMAPWGGYQAKLGTNPLGASFPANEESNFALDMATSVSAKGKIRSIKKSGGIIPRGWALDSMGNDTEDPDEAINGTMLPIGNHKGYGLSMMIDVLCAGISGASLSYETESVSSSKKNANIGHFFYLVDIGDLVPIDEFQSRMDNWFRSLKQSEKRNGIDKIFIPGEIEEEKRKNTKDILNIHEKTYQEILTLASQLNITN